MQMTFTDHAVAEMLEVLQAIRAEYLPPGFLPKRGTLLARVVQAIHRAEAAGLVAAQHDGTVAKQDASPLPRKRRSAAASERDSTPSRQPAQTPRHRRRRRTVKPTEAATVSQQDVMVDLERAMQEVGVSESSIYRWTRNGAVRTVLAPGRGRLYALADLQRIAAL